MVGFGGCTTYVYIYIYIYAHVVHMIMMMMMMMIMITNMIHGSWFIAIRELGLIVAEDY